MTVALIEPLSLFLTPVGFLAGLVAVTYYAAIFKRA